MPAINLLNPVQQLVKKLTSFDISDEILRQAVETLRIIDVKVRTGTLGNRIDRQDTRAAIILEHVYRQQTKERIPLDVLAKAAGVKATKLKELQNILVNYLQPIKETTTANRVTRAAASTEKNKRTSTAPSNAVSRPSTQNDSRKQRATTESQSFAANESILPELAIRLASKVPDPHGCVQAAQLLLDNIHKHVNTSTSRTMVGQLHDLQRFAVAYEAAAFFYFATRQQQHAGSRKGGRGKSAARNSETTADVLNLNDLEAASSDIILSEVKQTLPKIEKWVEQLAEKKDEAKGTDPQTKRPNTSTGSGGSKKRPRESVPNTASESLDKILGIDLNKADDMDDHVTPMSIREQQRESSAQWRANILANAILHAKQTFAADSAVDSTADSLSDEACLEFAANQVFAKYCLVSPEPEGRDE